jgi:hypothetical protein
MHRKTPKFLFSASNTDLHHYHPTCLNASIQRIVESMEIANTAENESPTSIVGQFCMTPDGHRVQVERVGAELDSSARAIVRRVEGPKAGTRSSCYVSSLKPLGFDIPLE